MRHMGCGGEIIEDPHIVYGGEGEGDTHYYGLVCQRCRKEILGNAEIELDAEYKILEEK